MNPRASVCLLPLLLLTGIACTETEDSRSKDDTCACEDSVDTTETADSGDSGDSQDTDDSADPVVDCADLGLPVLEFTKAPSDPTLRALAGDFTVPTTDGDWTLSERWTGCETYLFVLDNPRQNSGLDTDRFWSRDVNDLISRSPRNTHYFFVSTPQADSAREASLATIQAEIDEVLGELPAEDRAWWHAHVHYVTARARELDGWLGQSLGSPGWGVGIDRFQRIRYVGSYSDPRRYNSSVGWFDPNVSMVANEAIYYNFEAEREARLAADDALVLPAWSGDVISDPGWSGAMGYLEIEFPDAGALSAYDTLEIDHSLLCVGDGEYGDCPAWDYINWLFLCDVEEPERCDTEVGRWITTYHREGRWVHDLSPLLPMLGDGGTRRFAYYTQQPYEVHLSFRLSQRGKAFRPEEIAHLFSGGTFGPHYNDAYEPLQLTVPADAGRVLVAAVISGHGMSATGNCAEFCDTEHHFFVNGEDNEIEIAITNSRFGCMEQTNEGTVPNQYGTWWYGRDGWCPGKEVPMRILDVTDQVIPGEINFFDYEGYHDGAPHPGDDASIVMNAWLVVER
jgi:hypothetical protein